MSERFLDASYSYRFMEWMHHIWSMHFVVQYGDQQNKILKIKYDITEDDVKKKKMK